MARPPPAPPADAELAAVSTVVKATASTGKLDIGYEVVGEIKMAKTKVAAAPPTRNATAGYALEKQRLRLVGRADAGAFTGSFSLGFNGEESEALDISLLLGMASGTLNGSVPADAALEVERVLGDLPTVSGGDGTAVSVRALEYNTTLGIDLVTFSFDVHFHAGELVQSPLNLGPLPLLDIFAANLSGVVVAEASVLERGAFSSDPNTNGTFPEQRITFGGTPQQLRDAAPSVFFEVGFGGETAPTTLGLDASATELREALMGLTTVGELEVFRFDTPTAREYLIRFYAEGDPAHLKVDTLVNVTFVDGGSSGRRHRRELSGVIVIIDEVDSGSSEATDDAEASGDDALAGADAAGNGTVAADDDFEEETLDFTPVIHVCGNGARTTLERCDDNNTVGGDGCDALCEVEVGWACLSSSEADGGSGVGGLDTCSPVCGDGRRAMPFASEGCDDNNTVAGDGCSASCTVEPGWSCSGGSLTTPDACTTVCGDGKRAGSEVCDDGNRVANDGCGENCTAIDDGWTCAGGNATHADACQRCHASCATCSGPGASECVTCAAAFPFSSGPGTCAGSCTPLFMWANLTSMACEPCDATCDTCSGAATTDCLTCGDTLAFMTAAGECLAECPASTFVDIDVNTGASSCVACDGSCAECADASVSSCTECPNDKLFDEGVTPGLGLCVDACPSHRFEDTNTSSCADCDATCVTCSNGTDVGCDSCAGGQTLIGGACVGGCPLGEYLETEGLVRSVRRFVCEL